MDQRIDGQRTHRSPDSALAVVAMRQHGVFSRQQAFEIGFSRGMIDRRVSSGRWRLVDRNVYRSEATPIEWRQRLLAACLAGPAVASHRAAGLLWVFPSMPKEIVEVTALRHRRRRSTDVIWHESFHLTERDVTELDGIPVTRPVRTFLDLAVVLDAKPLEEVLHDGLHRNLLSIPAIWRHWEQLGPLRHGAGKVRALLDAHTASRTPESVLETRFLQVVRDAGLPLPVAQFEVPGIARIDFAYPDAMIAIELDGARFHASPEARERDRSRENELVARGWRVLRFTWADMHERQDRLVATMRALTSNLLVNERIERKGA